MKGNAKARQAQLQAQLGPACDVAVQPVPRAHRLRYMIACRMCHWWADDTRPAVAVTDWTEHEAGHRVDLRAQMIAAGMTGTLGRR